MASPGAGIPPGSRGLGDPRRKSFSVTIGLLLLFPKHESSQGHPWALLKALACALLRAPMGPLKGLGWALLEPPWALLRAWVRALLRAPLGPLKGLGPARAPLGPLKGLGPGPFKSPPGLFSGPGPGPWRAPMGPKGAQGYAVHFSKFDHLSYFKAPLLAHES